MSDQQEGADDARRVEPPNPSELPWALEAVLFASGEPQTIGALSRACGVGEGPARKALQQLTDDYRARGLRLIADGKGLYEVVHAPEYSKFVDRLLGAGPSQRLSKAALETLAIVAYKQPCTRGQVEAIRGVNSDKLITMLEARGLLESAGKASTPGRPHLFRPSLRFFEHFGLGGPSDMPVLPEPGSSEEVEI
ncbi:MAG TPA: SMC-Scp complex subunit ScpB [Dehalococcoidia bacterium]|jgi:segregation and condensation protein B|nr:SMC-Scp complex subunit ScpB [Dehalococcoidia bacterium]